MNFNYYRWILIDSNSMNPSPSTALIIILFTSFTPIPRFNSICDFLVACLTSPVPHCLIRLDEAYVCSDAKKGRLYKDKPTLSKLNMVLTQNFG